MTVSCVTATLIDGRRNIAISVIIKNDDETVRL